MSSTCIRSPFDPWSVPCFRVVFLSGPFQKIGWPTESVGLALFRGWRLFCDTTVQVIQNTNVIRVGMASKKKKKKSKLQGRDNIKEGKYTNSVFIIEQALKCGTMASNQNILCFLAKPFFQGFMFIHYRTLHHLCRTSLGLPISIDCLIEAVKNFDDSVFTFSKLLIARVLIINQILPSCSLYTLTILCWGD